MKRMVSLLGWMLVGSLFSAQAFAITLRVQGANASPGDTPDVCVYLDENDGTVSGLQVDLVWDSSCLTVDRGMGDQGACVMNPETGRSTFQTRVLANDRLRALMVSLNDTTPMPESVHQVFCCQFRVSPAAGGRTCGINVANVILSDRKGQRINVTGVGGSITVARAGDQGGVPVGGTGSGGVIAPAIVGGGQSGMGSGGAAAGAAPAAPPAAGVSGGAAPAAAPAVAPAPAVQAPPAAGVPAQVAPAPAEVMAGATPQAEGTAQPAVATPEPTAAGTAPTKPASLAKTPAAVGTPTPEGKKSPAQATPAGATPAGSPSPQKGKEHHRGKK
ncbi:MAG: hypothetical protein N3C12_14175 [Candidatus Binatia bacterium]|nr:hypothetical protein [Candidatus Binatia bacterium]